LIFDKCLSFCIIFLFTTAERLNIFVDNSSTPWTLDALLLQACCIIGIYICVVELSWAFRDSLFLYGVSKFALIRLCVVFLCVVFLLFVLCSECWRLVMVYVCCWVLCMLCMYVQICTCLSMFLHVCACFHTFLHVCASLLFMWMLHVRILNVLIKQFSYPSPGTDWIAEIAEKPAKSWKIILLSWSGTVNNIQIFHWGMINW